MPITIPRYEGHVAMNPEAPGVAGGFESVERAGAGWKKVGEAGEGLTKIGEAFRERMAEAKQLKELNDANFAAEDQNINLQKQVQEYDDPNEMVPAYRQGMEDFKKVSLSNISDPKVQEIHTKHFDKMFFSGLKKVQAAADRKNASIYLADVELNLQRDADLYVQADDDLERARIKGQAFGRLDAGVAAGAIWPDKAAKFKENWENYVMLAGASREILQDPVGAFKRLENPKENYPGMNEQTALTLRGRAQAEMHRLQNETYNGYMKGILGQAGAPGEGALQLPPLQQVKDDIQAERLNPHQGRDILAYVQGVKGNPQQKTDPQSYKEAVTRLTDPDDPLTREEFLGNVASGDWKFDAKTYGQFLVNIGTRGTKLEKATESAFKARVAYWKTQFGQDPKGDQVMTALGQAQAAKDGGELGSTPAEINKNLDAIFEPQHRLYMQEWGLGSFKPQPKTKQSWWDRLTGGGGKSPAPPTDQGTTTYQGKTYKIIRRNGRRAIDLDNPLSAGK